MVAHVFCWLLAGTRGASKCGHAIGAFLRQAVRRIHLIVHCFLIKKPLHIIFLLFHFRQKSLIVPSGNLLFQSTVSPFSSHCAWYVRRNYYYFLEKMCPSDLMFFSTAGVYHSTHFCHRLLGQDPQGLLSTFRIGVYQFLRRIPQPGFSYSCRHHWHINTEFCKRTTMNQPLSGMHPGSFFSNLLLRPTRSGPWCQPTWNITGPSRSLTAA